MMVDESNFDDDTKAKKLGKPNSRSRVCNNSGELWKPFELKQHVFNRERAVVKRYSFRKYGGTFQCPICRPFRKFERTHQFELFAGFEVEKTSSAAGQASCQ